jgi:hypothetical protein
MRGRGVKGLYVTIFFASFCSEPRVAVVVQFGPLSTPDAIPAAAPPNSLSEDLNSKLEIRNWKLDDWPRVSIFEFPSEGSQPAFLPSSFACFSSLATHH